MTEEAVRAALANPRGIDMDLVRAWQARRALDYLVGYGLSPVLWRKLPGCRSAGRVQSVALRLICEREAGIEAFVPRRYWTVEAEAAGKDGIGFAATLVRLDGTAIGEAGMAEEAAAREVARRIRGGSPGGPQRSGGTAQPLDAPTASRHSPQARPHRRPRPIKYRDRSAPK